MLIRIDDRYISEVLKKLTIKVFMLFTFICFTLVTNAQDGKPPAKPLPTTGLETGTSPLAGKPVTQETTDIPSPFENLCWWGDEIIFDYFKARKKSLYSTNISTPGKAIPKFPEDKTGNFECSYLKNGKGIVYTSNQNSNFDIFKFENNKNTQITFSQSMERSPAVSIDGSLIAYLQETIKGSNKYALLTMKIDGTGQIQILNDANIPLPPSWLDANKTILCTYKPPTNQKFEICSIDISSKNIIQLSNNIATDKQASYSNSKNEIVFSTNRDNNFEIFVMKKDGTLPRKITNTVAGDSFSPCWSPDGNQIAFVSYRDGKWGIWVVDYKGGNEIEKPKKLFEN